MKTHNGDARLLRQDTENIAEYYKGNHGKCSAESRCQSDPPSKAIITDHVAEKLLRDFFCKLPIYT